MPLPARTVSHRRRRLLEEEPAEGRIPDRRTYDSDGQSDGSMKQPIEKAVPCHLLGIERGLFLLDLRLLGPWTCSIRSFLRRSSLPITRHIDPLSPILSLPADRTSTRTEKGTQPRPFPSYNEIPVEPEACKIMYLAYVIESGFPDMCTVLRP